ncbi:hypothetical protein S245_054604 [Arachis hypogaea]|nr:uncharacterized protein DS421_16g530480 [Arachis hypogaea]
MAQLLNLPSSSASLVVCLSGSAVPSVSGSTFFFSVSPPHWLSGTRSGPAFFFCVPLLRSSSGTSALLVLSSSSAIRPSVPALQSSAFRLRLAILLRWVWAPHR